MNPVPFHFLWSIGELAKAKNKPHDVACAQVLLNLAAKPGIPVLLVDGKMTAATLEAIQTFQTKAMGLSKAVPCVEPGSTTVKALIAAAITGARRVLQFPAGNGTLIQESDYQAAAQSLGCEVAAVKAVAAVESAGHGFLPNGKPKILFEAHIFFARDPA
jgi:N-acetylmuramidase